MNEPDGGSVQPGSRWLRDVVVARFLPSVDLRQRASALLRVLQAADAAERVPDAEQTPGERPSS